MTISDIMLIENFNPINIGSNMDREITTPYCCDLLSIAMGKMPPGAAWVTVMGNVNTLAVACLTDAACIILAEGSKLDEQAMIKAKEKYITVFSTEMPIFDAALAIKQKIHG